MTCKEVAARFGVALTTVNHWAQDNGVEYAGEGKRKIYLWTEADVGRFAARRGRGWEKGRARKEKC
jgi:transposase